MSGKNKFEFEASLGVAIANMESEISKNSLSVITIEHLMLHIIDSEPVKKFLTYCDADHRLLKHMFQKYVDQFIPKIDSHGFECPVASPNFDSTMVEATMLAMSQAKRSIDCFDILYSVLSQKKTDACVLFNKINIDKEKLTDFLTGNPKRGGKPGEEGTMDNKFLVNLNELVKAGKIEAIIGRDKEVASLFQTLNKKKKNNAILLGEAGTGKTSIVEGLAFNIVNGKYDNKFKDATIYALSMGNLISDAKFRGEFEGRLKSVLDDMAKQKNALLFIDEIHTVMGAGSVGKQDSLDAGNILKPYLTNGSIKVIGATTHDDYRKYMQQDKAFMRRFQKIDVCEPDLGYTKQIIHGIKPAFEKHHDVYFEEGVVEAIVELAHKHMPNLFFPDKAIDILDEVGSIHNLKKSKIVTVDDIYLAFSEKYGIDVRKMGKSEDLQICDIKDNMKKYLFGQDEAVNKICDLILMSKFGFKNTDKPGCRALLIGQTGVGKTELAKQLADQLKYHLVRFDMSEFQTKEDVSKFIGTAPGYIGFDQGGLLVEAILKNPNAVVLFDEIEKAHQDVYNILLQIMDEGTLTDNTGKKADFKNTVILMTSNIGASDARDNKGSVGFINNIASSTGEIYHKAVKDRFKPEFINRLDCVILFNDLDKNVMTQIVDKFMGKLNSRLAGKNIDIVINDKVKEKIAGLADLEKMGGRPVERLIDTCISGPIMEHMIAEKIVKDFTVSIDVKKDEFVFKYKTK